jgi:septum formation protein
MATELRWSQPGRQMRRLSTVNPVVLASASPRRASILRGLGIEFEVLPADIDEAVMPGQPADELARSLAESKALAGAGFRTDAVIVAADTVVAFGGVPLGKPKDSAEAVAMLSSLSGRSHLVHTGVAVRSGGVTRSGIETTEVHMRNLTGSEIENYVRSGVAMDKAGAYGIQDELSPIESYKGSYLNVVGLPVGLLANLLFSAAEIDVETRGSIARSDAR